LRALSPSSRGAVLVTGAAGFVGSAITALLRLKGFNVITHARRAANGIDWAADLAQPFADFNMISGSIAAVVHCAAAVPSRSSSFQDNVISTTNLCAKLATMQSVERVIHLSSVAVYKRPARGEWTISEDAELVDVDDPDSDLYARSKRSSELALDALTQRRSDVTLIHLRASSVYGRGMVSTTLLPVLVTRALEHKPLRLSGPRGYTQNFVHVEDVADLAMALLLGQDSSYALNAFSDDTYELCALAHYVRDRIGSRSAIIDSTNDAELPVPIFANASAKRLQPAFRKLRDHLLDVA